MPQIQNGEHIIGYRETGAGYPLILTHGFVDTKDLWEPQLAAFQDRYRLIAWDLRGHGESSVPDAPAAYRLDRVMSDLETIYDHFGLNEAVLVGLSLGGYLSLEFFRRHPKRVRALILLSCSPGFRSAETRAAWNEGRAARQKRLLTRAEAARAKGEPPIEPGSGQSLIGLAHISGVLMYDLNAHDILPQIGVPTLLIVGDQDKAYHAATHLMVRRIPGARAAFVADADHRVNLDQPARVNALIDEFLNGLDLSASPAETL